MKDKNFIKLENIIIIFVFIIILAGIIFTRPIEDLDELWNFNFARNIANGLLPYKDFNMVQMPLLPIVCGTILKIFGTELFYMRCMAILLSCAILFTTYEILKRIGVNKYTTRVSILSIILLYMDHFCIDYNFMVALLILITIYIEIKNIDNKIEPKKEIALGMLVGSSILIKQTTGIVFSLVFVVYKLLIIYDRNKIKQEIKRLIFRLIGILIPMFILIVYLVKNNIYNECIDYTILGIKTFTNKISYINLLKGTYGTNVQILSIVMPILLVYMYIKTIILKVETKEDKILFTLFSYSTASLIVIYPISDSIHFLIGILPLEISFIYLVSQKLLKLDLNMEVKTILQGFTIIFLIMLLIILAFNIYNYYVEIKGKNYINNYKYILSDYENINKIDEFILSNEKKGKSVYILDAAAAMYMIPLNKYNKDYDMLMQGNFGSKRRRWHN